MTLPPPSQAAHDERVIVVGPDQVELLIDGVQTYPAMLQAIASARTTLCLETYILGDDSTGRRFAEALCERARAGVEVNVSYDGWGSSLSREFLDRLHEAGVRTLEFRPLRFGGRLARLLAHLRRRNHRKVLVVDGRVAFTGGLNVANHYAPTLDGGQSWRDTHVRIEGPTARALEVLFLRTWRKSGGQKVDPSRYPERALEVNPDLQVVASGLFEGGRRIRAQYLNLIRGAKQRLWLTNAYFLPPRKLLRALSQAARRGVDVQVLTAGNTDVPLVRLAAWGVYGSLLRAGVRVFEYHRHVLHAKTAVVDGTVAMVGSSNLDAMSLQINLELNVSVRSAGFATALAEQFERDVVASSEITIAQYAARSVWARFASTLALLLRGWL